jgi:hypothetical protein
MQKYLGHHRIWELFFLDDPSIQIFQHKAEHGKKPWWMHAHTKATMNTLVFPSMCNVSKQATHHIMTVASIHLCPCDVVVNGFTKFSSISNPPPQWPMQ